MRSSLFFIIFAIAFTTLAESKKSNPVIEAARAQVLLRNRGEALRILREGILVAKTPEPLIKELSRTATLFFTNEGQKAYELAESTRHAGRSGYLPKYDEALTLEGDNTLILKSKSLGLLATQNCKEAKALLLEKQEVNPHDAEFKFLIFKADICLSPKEADTILAKIDNAPAILKSAFAQKHFLNGDMSVALQYANEAIKLDSEYPAGYFWAWKVLSAEKSEGADVGEKYISLCKSISPAVRRKYYLDPDLCHSLTQVQEFLKQAEGQAQ